MRKLVVRVLFLALILVAAVLLRGRFKSGEAEPENPAADSGVETLEVVKTEKQLTLGRITENADQGGVDIAVADEQGGETVYTFTDVTIDSWYAEAVNYAVSNGLMNGVSDQTVFQPEYGVKRESFALILYRFAGGEPVASPRSVLDDVSEDDWYRDAVYWAAEKRLIPGERENHFGVGEFLTVEEALQAVYRLAGRPKTEATLADYPYALKVTEDGRPAVAWAWESGLIGGDECVWYPTQTISRAQAALLLMRYSQLE